MATELAADTSVRRLTCWFMKMSSLLELTGVSARAGVMAETD